MRPFVLITVALITLILIFTTRELNFIASDEERLYLPATKQLPFVRYLSELSSSAAFDNAHLVRGKEITLWHFSQMQRLLNDRQSLRPLLWTVILFWAFSALLIYLISRNYWGGTIGLFSFLIFVGSFWPLMYVLLVKHQPVGLFYFLLSVFLLQQIRSHSGNSFCFLLSGITFAASLYASTVSILYVGLWAAAILYQKRLYFCRWQELLWIAGGVTGTIIILSYPHPVDHIRQFLEYVKSSQSANHFAYHQIILKPWMEDPAKAFGGLTWIIKYLLLMLPVLLPALIFCTARMLFNKKHRWTVLILVLVCLSPVIFAYASHAAQYGANYFPALIGFIALAGYLMSVQNIPRLFYVAFFVIYLVWNALVFWTDILPTRLSSVNFGRFLQQKGINEIFVHRRNPLNAYTLGKISDRILNTIKIKPIDQINEVKDGYIAIAPITGSSIYLAITEPYGDYDQDIYLNHLIDHKQMNNYAVVSLKTMASSRFWRQEEETLSYRDLILNQFNDPDDQKTRIWLLEANRFVSLQPKEFLNTKLRGEVIRLDKTTQLSDIKLNLSKIDPSLEQMMVYVYKRGVLNNTMAWLPYGKNTELTPGEYQIMFYSPEY